VVSILSLSFQWELTERPLMDVLKRLLLATPDELVKAPKKKQKRPLLRRGWRPNALRPLWR
jgi:hypothetical protein